MECNIDMECNVKSKHCTALYSIALYYTISTVLYYTVVYWTLHDSSRTYVGRCLYMCIRMPTERDWLSLEQEDI